MSIKHLLLSFALLLTVSAAWAQQTYYVTQNGGTITKDGLSWATAYGEAEFRTALQNANSGAIFFIAKGIYKPTNDNNREATFTLKKGVKMYGGFAGTEDLSTDEKLTAALAARNPENAPF